MISMTAFTSLAGLVAFVQGWGKQHLLACGLLPQRMSERYQLVAQLGRLRRPDDRLKVLVHRAEHPKHKGL
ncbi:hypothetical protein [Kibdelosporangium philippinense]|uniref:hypothetical protein n=1 Tax=Kibdelosporangium philippinense TaxID=211113 RepID=UPI00361ABF57